MTAMINERTYESNNKFKVKDPISALTHYIAFLCAIGGTPILLIHAAQHGAQLNDLVGLAIFMISMITLYGASTTYHSFDVNEKVDKLLKKIDHMSIFLSIAGSYTPICISVLQGNTGLFLLILIWSLALAGMIFKFCWVTCPKWVSSVIYIGMGWAVITVMPQVVSTLTPSGFFWLLTGGIIYSVGGIIYALKLNIIPQNNIGFGNHELFHLFVMAGSLCHFIFMFQCF